MALNVAPNTTANMLMGTATFDNGAFWLIIDSEPLTLGFTLAGFGIVLVGYVFALLKMTLWRHKQLAASGFRDNLVRQLTGLGGLRHSHFLSSWSKLTGFQGEHRKLWVG